MPPRKQPAKKIAEQISFRFIKSNFFRVICADGAFGGISPNGRTLHMAVFSERRALPDKTVYGLIEGKKLGEEDQAQREGTKGFIREVEADLSMDLATAVSLNRWMRGKIDEMAKIHGVTVDFVSGTISMAKPDKGGNGISHKVPTAPEKK